LGTAGRVPPAPEGMIYVRDPAAASAKAIKDAVALFEATGTEVPEHLAELAAALGGDVDDVIIEVESDFPVEPGRYTELEGAPEPEVVEPEEALPEPEPEPEPAEPEPEPEAEEEFEELGEFTVAELKDQLDALGVEYPSSARKAELIALVQQAEG
jgi:hypothetical protein